MDTANYIVLSRQIGLFNQIDVVANNIANANTDGFKSESLLFKEYVVNSGHRSEASFTSDVSTVRNVQQGDLRSTQRSLDASIDGDGYYAVQTPLGVRYTRAGAFHINPAGQLATKDGYAILDNGSPINFSQGDHQVSISEDGTVEALSPQGTKENKGNLSVFKFENPYAMKKLGNNLYSAKELPVLAVAQQDYRIAQGMLENSNVNTTKELTTMIKLNRSVGATSKFITDVHDMQRKAVSVISKMQ